MTTNTPIKSPDLLKAEAHVKARATIEEMNQEPAPVDTVTYRTEIDPISGRMKRVPITQLDINDQLVDEYQERADAQNRMIRAEEEAKADDANNVESLLTATERRINLERYFTPILKDLTVKHIEACDRVTEFESDETRFRTNIQDKWAFECKHPDIRTLQVMGDEHFKYLMQSGQLQPDGYKLVDRRSMGGLSHKLVFIPHGTTSLMHYADSDQAKAFSQAEYDRDLARLIQKRKNAAVELTRVREQAREALESIPTFESLLSDGIKRSRK